MLAYTTTVVKPSAFCFFKRKNTNTQRYRLACATAARTPERESSSCTIFSWEKQWYPIVPEEDVDKDIPHAFELLGRKLVIWFNPINNTWSCFADICPHRLAPLTKGRIDKATGCLECSYHAWSFMSDGKCFRIPQLDEDSLEKVKNNSRSRAETYPLTVSQGLIFVWADSGSTSEASEKLLPVIPGVDGPGWQSVATFRDVDYGWETAVENFVDPSHVPVAHHNVNGGVLGKRTDAKPLALKVIESGPLGFRGQLEKVDGPPTNHEFQPPSRFTYDFSRKGSTWKGAVTTYATPTAPGKCRLIVVNSRNFLLGFSSGPLWYQILPRWFDHQMMLNLLDGDLAFLHSQERELEKRKGESEKIQSVYFMPASADKYVIALRNWISKFGSGGPTWPDGMSSKLPPLILEDEKLLDRYNSHTKKCQSCRKALNILKRLQKIAYFLTFSSLLLAAAVCSLKQKWTLLLCAFSAFSALFGWNLNSWITSFYYKGWDAARMD